MVFSRFHGQAVVEAEPVDERGRPLQGRIIDETMRGASVLGILPSDTAKSVC